MKTWEKPVLVILTRPQRAEAVLGFCKDGSDTDVAPAAPNGSPSYVYDACMVDSTGCGPCQQIDLS